MVDTPLILVTGAAGSVGSVGRLVVGDLSLAADVTKALDGCQRMYFGMSVSSQYLEAALVTAAAARAYGGLQAFVNMSQMTVSQMDLTRTAESQQQRQH
ncbi:hypothetical protein ABT173_30300 [Streptomyces sp. NPDC001795]|uniref:hypothetical protein n=1 Tax=unclassified Streptomyces TaxID=2593676 RepID=UPI0033283EFD